MSVFLSWLCLPLLLVEHGISKLLRRESVLEELMQAIGETTDALDINDIERVVEFEER
jgi:hypothetical protein